MGVLECRDEACVVMLKTLVPPLNDLDGGSTDVGAVRFELIDHRGLRDPELSLGSARPN